MAARWVPVDQVLAVAEQCEEASWTRYQHGHRVAAFAAAQLDVPSGEQCSWQATELPGPRGPWAGLRDRELAEQAAELVRLNGLRPTCRRLNVDHQTLRRAWRHHGIEVPTLQHGRRFA